VSIAIVAVSTFSGFNHLQRSLASLNFGIPGAYVADESSGLVNGNARSTTNESHRRNTDAHFKENAGPHGFAIGPVRNPHNGANYQ
jgi:hypothetical protein